MEVIAFLTAKMADFDGYNESKGAAGVDILECLRFEILNIFFSCVLIFMH